MVVCLSLKFAAFLFFICGGCATESFADGRFRTTNSGPKPLWTDTTLDKLKKDLLMNYDKHARPEEHYNNTKVKFGMTMLHLETNELKSTVTAHVWLRMVWSDSKLKWNESDYGGLSVARISDHEIWQPDIYLSNSANGGESSARFGNPNLLIYPNGEVLWVPPAKLTALCKFNLRQWPFDTQLCQFRFRSWTHRGSEISLTLYGNQHYVEIETSMSWSTWNISNSTGEIRYTEHSCCEEPFYTAQFNLTLVRKPGPYKAIVVTPAVVIAMLVLSQFWLPPQAKERFILNGFVVVTIVMFLTYFTNQIAAAGSETPFIVTFYSNSLYMVCHSMLATAAALSLSRINKKSTSLPWAVKKHLKGKLGKWLLLEYTLEKNCTDEVLSENRTAKSEVRRKSEDGYEVKLAPEKESKENLLLALLIDRLLFVVYIILVLVVVIEYYVI